MKPLLRTAVLAVLLAAPQLTHAIAIINVTRDHVEANINVSVVPGANDDGWTVYPEDWSASYSGRFQPFYLPLTAVSPNYITDEFGQEWQDFTAYTSEAGLSDFGYYLGHIRLGGEYLARGEWYAEARNSFFWDFTVIGDGAEMYFGLEPTFGNITLLDKTTGVAISSPSNEILSDWGETVNLIDGHDYVLAASIYREDFGNGDPDAHYFFGFQNAEVHIPDAGATAGLLAGAFALLAFARGRRR